MSRNANGECCKRRRHADVQLALFSQSRLIGGKLAGQDGKGGGMDGGGVLTKEMAASATHSRGRLRWVRGEG